MKKYKLLAEEILEEYVNAYSEVDLDRVANKLEEIAKDTAKEILQMLYTAMPKTNIVVEIKKRYGVEVE